MLKFLGFEQDNRALDLFIGTAADLERGQRGVAAMLAGLPLLWSSVSHSAQSVALLPLAYISVMQLP